jgi:hypothetical protein
MIILDGKPLRVWNVAGTPWDEVMFLKVLSKLDMVSRLKILVLILRNFLEAGSSLFSTLLCDTGRLPYTQFF